MKKVFYFLVFFFVFIACEEREKNYSPAVGTDGNTLYDDDWAKCFDTDFSKCAQPDDSESSESESSEGGSSDSSGTSGSSSGCTK